MLTTDGRMLTSGGVRERGGRMLEFTRSTTSGDPQRSAEEEQPQHDWGQVGAKVTGRTDFPADQIRRRHSPAAPAGVAPTTPS